MISDPMLVVSILKRQDFHLQMVSIPFRLLFLTGSYIVSRTLRAIAALLLTYSATAVSSPPVSSDSPPSSVS